MSHNVGRIVATGPTVIGPAGGSPGTGGVWQHSFTPQPALSGGQPRFVMLHLTGMSLPGSSRVEVELGYATDVFTASSGADAWARPVDPALGPVVIRYIASGTTGGVTLAEYGSGEPWTTTYPTNPTHDSTTNPDLFFHTSPYNDPQFHSTFRCGTTFDFQNAACVTAGSVEEQTARAVCVLVMAHYHGTELHLSTCSGTLIDTNLVITARHCASSPDGIEVHSGSVTFDYLTKCDQTRPTPHTPFFHKIRREVAWGSVGETYTTATDWVIFEIDPVPATITPRPLRSTPAMPNEAIFALHHPNGAVKKFQSGTLTSGTPTSVTGFDYAGGSSGSALFDSQGRVIGAALSSGAGCNVGYTPARNVLDVLATPAAPPTPFDIMLVIDRSGSMSAPGTSGPGATKMDDAREAASLFVQLIRLNGGDRLGMVSFSTTASNPVDEAPGNVNNGQKNQLVGNAPYTGGKVGALAADGMTTIGGGIQQAMSVLPPGTGNQRAIVLLTDGMQNTAPTVETVEGSLGDTRLFAVGFGAESQLDGALLHRLARDHNGYYTRAHDGLALKKFFAICFGNIFESGQLADPDRTLKAGRDEEEAVRFDVCDEDRITVTLAWDLPQTPLEAVLVSPLGTEVSATTAGAESDRGRTWFFVRTALPVGGEREGTWQVRVRRPRVQDGELREVAAATTGADVRYTVSVLADGGPRLVPVLPPRKLYTGDPITPKVALRYANGTAPLGQVTLEVERPDASIGALVEQHGLRPSELGDDVVDPFHAAFSAVEREQGPLPTTTVTVPLYDDGLHDDGAMDRDGVWGNPLDDLLRHEGTYSFRAIATYGHDCPGRRETQWSLHVEPGMDPDRTEVTLLGGSGQGVIRIRPRDRYGNPLGPGRGGTLTTTPTPGTTVTGPVQDRGDGSYDVPVSWGSSAPGVVVTQPERDPVPLWPSGGGGGRPGGCLLWLCLLLAALVVVLVVALVLTVD